MANRLVNSNSPYLIQHAYNPVDWFPWGQEALVKAAIEDKPIFLSIGYAACHWCHVMAHESFEDPGIAEILNNHFVSIKVDREERPDIDDIYMNAVISMTGQGGWPLSVFLTPKGEPFYGGTYFPPIRRYNMPSFSEILSNIIRIWQDDRSGLQASAGNITAHLKRINQVQIEGVELNREQLIQAAFKLAQSYDWEFGGWGKAPKFPQPMVMEFLLRLAASGDTLALDLVSHCLNAMAKGGMYDVVGGGFARYSTDDKWLVPHFEKMLYDNAQLARVYLHAYVLTKDETFRNVCTKTLDFIINEMTNTYGGFMSSIDADSEGSEGIYYLWSKKEIFDALQDKHDADFLIKLYDITETGNFEGLNVLQRSKDYEQLSKQYGVTIEQLTERAEDLHNKLYDYREKRVRPDTDDKVLVSWNALAVIAFSEAARYLGSEKYLKVAIRNIVFLLSSMYQDRHLFRSWRDGCAQHNGYLEDYSGLSLALLSLYQSNPNTEWFTTAKNLLEIIQTRFHDPTTGFFDTANEHESLITRPKRVQDNAIPSGNSLAATALLQLSAYTGDGNLRDYSEQMIGSVFKDIIEYPLAYGNWLCASDFALNPAFEVGILGVDLTQSNVLVDALWQSFRPNLVAAISTYPPPPDAPALLNDRTLLNNEPTAYVCQNHICTHPVTEPNELMNLLSSSHNQ